VEALVLVSRSNAVISGRIDAPRWRKTAGKDVAKFGGPRGSFELNGIVRQID
jgi:hypothetical protein